jgi:CO/xanthine dehydrogenase FAD-binding subunit
MPTIADVPEIVTELSTIPDEHLTNLGSKGLGEPPIVPDAAAIANAIRDATGAEITSLPITREEMLRALRRGAPPHRGTGWSCSGLRPPTRRSRRSATARVRSRAGRSSSRSCATGSSRRRRSSTCPRASRAAVDGTRIGAGTTLGELEVDPQIPDALREACRLAASPQLRAMGTIAGNLRQATRCWYWRLKYPCYLHGGDRCHAREGQHREHAIFANDPARPATLRTSPPRCSHSVRASRRRAASSTSPSSTACRPTTTATSSHSGPDELILELDVPAPDASVYLKAMDRRRWAFPLVGVGGGALRRRGALGLAGVAPIPWAIGGEQDLDAATPLPGTAYKVEIARALVRRARAAV